MNPGSSRGRFGRNPNDSPRRDRGEPSRDDDPPPRGGGGFPRGIGTPLHGSTPRGRGAPQGGGAPHRGRGDRGGGNRGNSPMVVGPGRRLGDDEFTPGKFVDGPSAGQQVEFDKEVHSKENAISQNLPLRSLSLSGARFPVRPAYGTSGLERRPLLKTNSFRIDINPEVRIFRYAVDITLKKSSMTPDEKNKKPSRRIRERAFDLLFETPDFQGPGNGLASDRANLILTTKELNLDADGCKTYDVLYREAEEATPRPGAKTYQFAVKFDGTVPIAELINYLGQPETMDFNEKEATIQALNIIISRTPNTDPRIFQAGRNKFYHYPERMHDYIGLGDGLIAVRGYYSSVRTSTLRTLLNVNAQCSPFYPAKNMHDLMEEHCHFDSKKWKALEDFIKKVRVKTQYMRTKDGQKDVRVKTVFGLSHKFETRADPKDGTSRQIGNAPVDHGDAQQITFECADYGAKSTIAVKTYFERKYNVTLKKPTDWLLNCGSFEKPVWIPPELCEVMPGQAFRGKLSERQTNNILTVAARPPAENARRIIGKGLDVIGIRQDNPILSAFGIEVARDMIQVAARILKPPEVLYVDKTTSKFKSGAKQASWNILHKSFVRPKTLPSWSYLTFGKSRFPQDFLGSFLKALRDTGMNAGPPVNDVNTRGFVEQLSGLEKQNDARLNAVFDKMKACKVNYVLVILPDNKAATYARIKYWGEVKKGIQTTCILEDNLGRGAQYYANVALKFNLKCGGQNHKLDDDSLRFLSEGKTMIVGIDVTHPAPHAMAECPSIAGVVACTDTTFSQWPGSVRCQESRQEMVADLELMVVERLDLWRKTNKSLPSRIIFFRDGVSEGQYETVLRKELPQIRKACSKMYGSKPPPQISIVVVGKRHHIRFYPNYESDADMSKMGKGNPKPGTIVDRGIVSEKLFDFYLQAHECIQGTAKPAHYVVILDEMKLGADQIQKLIHNLCYTFGRATRAVSVVPPAYYADLICERGRCYIQQYLNQPWPPGKTFDPNEADWYQQALTSEVKDTMFYI